MYFCTYIYLDKDSIDNKRRIFMAKEKHVEGEADHYIKTLIGAVLGYAADGLDMFLLSFILFVNPFSDFIIKPSSPFINPLACFGADEKDFCVWVSVLDIFLAFFNIEIKIR